MCEKTLETLVDSNQRGTGDKSPRDKERITRKKPSGNKRNRMYPKKKIMGLSIVFYVSKVKKGED